MDTQEEHLHRATSCTFVSYDAMGNYIRNCVKLIMRNPTFRIAVQEDSPCRYHLTMKNPPAGITDRGIPLLTVLSGSIHALLRHI